MFSATSLTHYFPAVATCAIEVNKVAFSCVAMTIRFWQFFDAGPSWISESLLLQVCFKTLLFKHKACSQQTPGSSSTTLNTLTGGSAACETIT